MSAVDPKAVFNACIYINGLVPCTPGFELGRMLLLLPEHRWVRFLEFMVAELPASAPEQQIAAMLRRIVVDGLEVVA